VRRLLLVLEGGITVKVQAPNVFERETRRDFETWISDYLRGYVINRKSSNDVTIHFGGCGHFKGNVGQDLIRNRKVPSRIRGMLEASLAKKGEDAPQPCHDCHT
jgi:hypothetical protein